MEDVELKVKGEGKIPRYYQCGQRGHIKIDCPSPPAETKDKNETAPLSLPETISGTTSKDEGWENNRKKKGRHKLAVMNPTPQLPSTCPNPLCNHRSPLPRPT